jgi:two-component system, OmpR family, alkaline phosphatase synthesis response regulator PhoP
VARRLFLVARDELAQRLGSELQRAGFIVASARPGEEIGHLTADLALVEMTDEWEETGEVCRHLKLMHRLPAILLLPKSYAGTSATLPGDDFILEPYATPELALRIKRLLGQSEAPARQIKAGDLVIDPAEAEVYLNGQMVELTFREYELLRYLLEHQGRVLSRQALLNAVWGYDYFGGDRTVDVHIRRLRSKIEDSEHSFIDTVRNMGYRLRKQD